MRWHPLTLAPAVVVKASSGPRYVVGCRTKLDKASTVFNVGRYIDTIVPTPEGLKFAERLCVFDSEMIPNAIIYPI